MSLKMIQMSESVYKMKKFFAALRREGSNSSDMEEINVPGNSRSSRDLSRFT